MWTGSCLCGGVRFRVEGALAPIQVCHCSQCRKAQGTPFATNLPVARAAFHLDAGEDLLQAYESSPGKERVFCRRCGSPLFSRRADLPEAVRLRAGLLDGDLETRPLAHFHCASAANWWPMDDDGLPHYAESLPPGERLRMR